MCVQRADTGSRLLPAWSCHDNVNPWGNDIEGIVDITSIAPRFVEPPGTWVRQMGPMRG